LPIRKINKFLIIFFFTDMSRNYDLWHLFINVGWRMFGGGGNEAPEIPFFMNLWVGKMGLEILILKKYFRLPNPKSAQIIDREVTGTYSLVTLSVSSKALKTSSSNSLVSNTSMGDGIFTVALSNVGHISSETGHQTPQVGL
jgi:hypothetical protein